VAGRKFLAPPYYSQRTVFASLRALFPFRFAFVPNLTFQSQVNYYIVSKFSGESMTDIVS